MSAASAERWLAWSGTCLRTAPASSFSDTVTLPDVVELYIPQREQTLRAKVQWRRNDEIGVGFTATERVAEVSSSPTEVVQRVAMLEAEIASLRALLKRLKAEKISPADEAAA